MSRAPSGPMPVRIWGKRVLYPLGDGEKEFLRVYLQSQIEDGHIRSFAQYQHLVDLLEAIERRLQDFCSCGRDIPSGARYCDACGAAVGYTGATVKL